MRLANLDNRVIALVDGGGVDIASASGGELPADPMGAIGRLDDIGAFLEAGDFEPDPMLGIDAAPAFGAPVPHPSQVFAVGLNYKSHGDETGFAIPAQPMIFTKFPSSIAGPSDPIRLPNDTVDWEVELVAVVGRPGRDIAGADAWGHLAGFCVGQDISERTSQMADVPPQFSLAKSYAGFAPIGPWLTTLDEFSDPTDLAISCSVDGETLQESRTSRMIFDIATIVEFVSSRCELRVGDLLFTGTPAGVGFTREPPRFLQRGTTLVSTIEGVGELRNPLV